MNNSHRLEIRPVAFSFSRSGSFACGCRDRASAVSFAGKSSKRRRAPEVSDEAIKLSASFLARGRFSHLAEVIERKKSAGVPVSPCGLDGVGADDGKAHKFKCR